MQQLQYNRLFRWFVGIAIDEAVWDHSVFSKNRDRLNGNEVAAECLREVVVLAQKRDLMLDEHYLVGRHAVAGLGLAQEFSSEG